MKYTIIKLILLLSLVTSSFAGGGGDILRAKFTADNFEYQANSAKTLYWDTFGYIGYDLNKIYLYSEGEKTSSNGSSSQNQLLYSRAIAPFWDIQAGVDYDIANDGNSNHNKTWGNIQLFGLAPYFFETQIGLLIGDKGDLGLRVDIDYRALITQRLMLIPRFTLDAYSQDSPQMTYGAGISDIALSLRLSYQIRREFAPYVGVKWAKNFGRTNEYTPLDNLYTTVGLRFWF